MSEADLTEDKLFYLKNGLIYRLICAPKSWSKERIENDVTNNDPPGTSANRWVCTDVDEELKENPIVCDQDYARMHWVLNC